MLVAYNILEKIVYIGAGLGGISGLIFFHELGHFLFCKLFKIDTPTFSIGIGPQVFSRMIGKTRFVIAAIPMGGYVEIAGITSETTSDTSEIIDETHFFGKKPFYQKLLVMLGGIFFNLIFAYTVFSMVHFVGAPATPLLYRETAIPIVKEVLKDSPAEKAGLLAGDIITTAGTTPLSDTSSPVFLILTPSIQYDSLDILRDQQPMHINIEHDNGIPASSKPGLGIVFQTLSQPGVPFIQAIQRGIASTNRWIYDTARGLLHIFKQRDFSQAGGPIKIVSMIAKSASDGLIVYLLFLAVISVNLAMFNLLPIPILDGGQILICSIEAITRRSLPLKAREYIFVGTWLLFLALILYLSFNDLGLPHIITSKVAQLIQFFKG
jgi:regulator of sigma E protease